MLKLITVLNKKNLRLIFCQTYISLLSDFFLSNNIFFLLCDFPDHWSDKIWLTYWWCSSKYISIYVWLFGGPQNLSPHQITLIESGWDPETNSKYFFPLEKEKINKYLIYSYDLVCEQNFTLYCYLYTVSYTHLTLPTILLV